MKRIRKDIRLSAQEKELLEKLAQENSMSVTEYVKYKLFEQNASVTNQEYIFHCPSGERYNYAIAGLSMLNYLMLESLLTKAYGDNTDSIKNQNIERSRKILEDLYGYTKTKVKHDE